MAIRRTVAALLVAASLCGCSMNRPARYLFVVPEQLPDGTDSTPQRTQLEGWLVQRAGGFTEIEGVRGGWLAPGGETVTESNRLYLVTVPSGKKRFREELRQQIIGDLKQEEAWIERW